MKNTVRVEGHKDYVRDKNTGAILNINTSEISIARERKMIRKQKEKELEEMSKLYNIAPDQLRTMLAPQGGLETLKGDLKFRKAIDILVENGKAK